MPGSEVSEASEASEASDQTMTADDSDHEEITQQKLSALGPALFGTFCSFGRTPYTEIYEAFHEVNWCVMSCPGEGSIDTGDCRCGIMLPPASSLTTEEEIIVEFRLINYMQKGVCDLNRHEYEIGKIFDGTQSIGRYDEVLRLVLGPTHHEITHFTAQVEERRRNLRGVLAQATFDVATIAQSIDKDLTPNKYVRPPGPYDDEDYSLRSRRAKWSVRRDNCADLENWEKSLDLVGRSNFHCPERKRQLLLQEIKASMYDHWLNEIKARHQAKQWRFLGVAERGTDMSRYLEDELESELLPSWMHLDGISDEDRAKVLSGEISAAVYMKARRTVNWWKRRDSEKASWPEPKSDKQEDIDGGGNREAGEGSTSRRTSTASVVSSLSLEPDCNAARELHDAEEEFSDDDITDQET